MDTSVHLLVHEWTSVATYSFQKCIQVHILKLGPAYSALSFQFITTSARWATTT